MNPSFVSRWNQNNQNDNSADDRYKYYDTMNPSSSSASASNPQQQQYPVSSLPNQNTPKNDKNINNNNHSTNKYLFDREQQQQQQPFASTAQFGGLRKIPGEPRYVGGTSVLAPFGQNDGRSRDGNNYYDNYDDGEDDDDQFLVDALDDEGDDDNDNRYHQPGRNNGNNNNNNNNNSVSPSRNNFDRNVGSFRDMNSNRLHQSGGPTASGKLPYRRSPTSMPRMEILNEDGTSKSRNYFPNSGNSNNENNNNNNNISRSRTNNAMPPSIYDSIASTGNHNQLKALSPITEYGRKHAPSNTKGEKMNVPSADSSSTPFYNLGGNNILSSFRNQLHQQQQQNSLMDDVDLEPPPTHANSKLDKYRSGKDHHNNNNIIDQTNQTSTINQPPTMKKNIDEEGQLDELDLLLFTISQHGHHHNKNANGKKTGRNGDAESTYSTSSTASSTNDVNSSTLPSPPLSEKDAMLFHKLMQRKVLWVRRAQISLFDWATKLQAYEQALHEREARLADTEAQRANAYQERVLALTEAESLVRRTLDKQQRISAKMQRQQQEQEKKFEIEDKEENASKISCGGNRTTDFSFGQRLAMAQKHLENPTGSINSNPASFSSLSARPSSISALHGGDSYNMNDLSPTSQFSASSPPQPNSLTPVATMASTGQNINNNNKGNGGGLGQMLKSALRAPSYATINNNLVDEKAKRTAFVVP